MNPATAIDIRAVHPLSGLEAWSGTGPVHGFADDEAVVTAIRMGDSAFEAYRENECGAVYEQWRDGTIRNMMSLTCSIGLTDERTRTIWSSWLTYMDSTPPILPEPRSTR